MAVQEEDVVILGTSSVWCWQWGTLRLEASGLECCESSLTH